MLSQYMKPVRLNLYGCTLWDAEAHVTSMLSGYKQGGGGWSMLRLFAAEVPQRHCKLVWSQAHSREASPACLTPVGAIRS